MITDDMIRCWRVNYGLDDRSPVDAAAWWASKMGNAPPGAVAALGTCIEEIERLQRDRDKYHDALVARHGGEPIALLSELDEARAERDQWQALAAAADVDKRTAEKQRDDALSELAMLHRIFEDWKVVHSTVRIQTDLATAMVLLSEARPWVLNVKADDKHLSERIDAALSRWHMETGNPSPLTTEQRKGST